MADITKIPMNRVDGLTEKIDIIDELESGMYSLEDFTGADGTNAGTHGLVPAPAATDNTKFLKGDGTYDSAADVNLSNISAAGLNVINTAIANANLMKNIDTTNGTSFTLKSSNTSYTTTANGWLHLGVIVPLYPASTPEYTKYCTITIGNITKAIHDWCPTVTSTLSERSFNNGSATVFSCSLDLPVCINTPISLGNTAPGSTGIPAYFEVYGVLYPEVS